METIFINFDRRLEATVKRMHFKVSGCNNISTFIAVFNSIFKIFELNFLGKRFHGRIQSPI